MVSSSVMRHSKCDTTYCSLGVVCVCSGSSTCTPTPGGATIISLAVRRTRRARVMCVGSRAVTSAFIDAVS